MIANAIEVENFFNNESFITLTFSSAVSESENTYSFQHHCAVEFSWFG
jgi:hypothetical protein